MSKVEELLAGTAEKINALAENSIIAKNAYLYELSKMNKNFEAAGKNSPEQLPAEYWKFTGLFHALSRVQKFVNIDYLKVNDIELLGTTRFVCEMAMWVRYLENPNNNSFEYYACLLAEKKRHFRRDIEQMQHEIETMRGFQVIQDERLRQSAEHAALNGLPVPKEEEVIKILKSVEVEAAKQFSIYSDFSRDYNFGPQADWVENERLPTLTAGFEAVGKEISNFEAETGYKAIEFKWFNLAKLVNMEREYDFIYRLTSRLLHASPISLSPEMSALSLHERYIFLQYLLAKFNEILQITLEVISVGQWRNRPT